MADYSALFRDDPELLSRALASYDAARPEAAPPAQAQGETAAAPSSYAQTAQDYMREAGIRPTPAADNAYGAVEPGNIDLSKRPRVRNKDGTISTVRSMGVNMDGKEYLIPTVSDDGRVMSDKEAVDTFRKTGRHLGAYDSVESSNAAAEAIHRDQEKTLTTEPRAVEMTITPDEAGANAGRVVAPTGTLGQQRQQLVTERVEALNDTGESFVREGEAKAEGSSKAAQLYAGVAKRAAEINRRAEERYENDQERAAKYRAYADEDFERLRQEPPKAGWAKNAFNVITGIIGAAAGGTTADALNMLRAHVNRSAEQDAQERMAAKERLAVGKQIHDTILDDSANELDASAKIVANQWLVAAKQLEQIANESNVPVIREQALRLKAGAEDQARGILTQSVEQQIATAQAEREARAKAAAASAKEAAKGPDYENMSRKELEALERAGVLTERGAVALKKHREAAAAGGTGDEKQLAVGDLTPSGRKVADAGVYNQLSPGERKAISDMAQNADDLTSTIEALEKVRRENPKLVGLPGTDAYRTARALGDDLKLQVKTGRALGTLDKGSVEFLEGMAGDPNAWFINAPEENLRVIKQRARLNANRRMHGVGLDVPTEQDEQDAIDKQAADFAKPKAAPAAPGDMVARRGAGGRAY